MGYSPVSVSVRQISEKSLVVASLSVSLHTTSGRCESLIPPALVCDASLESDRSKKAGNQWHLYGSFSCLESRLCRKPVTRAWIQKQIPVPDAVRILLALLLGRESVAAAISCYGFVFRVLFQGRVFSRRWITVEASAIKINQMFEPLIELPKAFEISLADSIHSPSTHRLFFPLIHKPRQSYFGFRLIGHKRQDTI